MRDDLAALNIGQAKKDYDRDFFWRSYRDVEMFMTRVLSKGPVEVSILRADDITVSGAATFTSVATSGAGTFGYVEIQNATNAYLRLKDTGATGNSVNAGLDMVGSNDAGRMFLGTDGTTGKGYLTSYTGDLVLTATGGVVYVPGNMTVTGTIGGAGSIQLNASSTNNIEIGRMDGVASTPYIDFHSGATTTDFDVRLMASGGTGATGQGVLTLNASSLLPGGATGVTNLGSTASRWGTVYTSDLSLSNGIGDWTIVEGEDDLFITNNKTGKRYKFVLMEVGDGD